MQDVGIITLHLFYVQRVITMQQNRLYRAVISTILFAALSTGCLFPITAYSSGVTGRYLKTSGTTVVLELSVGKPAPSSIIVEHSFTTKNQVLSASPKPKKINSKSGQVKWLVTNIRPGRKQFSLQLAEPLKGAVQGSLRYREPSTGQFTEKTIRP